MKRPCLCLHKLCHRFQNRIDGVYCRNTWNNLLSTHSLQKKKVSIWNLRHWNLCNIQGCKFSVNVCYMSGKMTNTFYVFSIYLCHIERARYFPVWMIFPCFSELWLLDQDHRIIWGCFFSSHSSYIEINIVAHTHSLYILQVKVWVFKL
jgi:hypothetical protein